MRWLVLGARGMVGSAICRALAARGHVDLVGVDRGSCDLRDSAAARRTIEAAAPDRVILAAATVGGIAANLARPADFIGDNLAIALSVVQACHGLWRGGKEGKLLLLGSSCIYPRACPQPIREEMLLSGPLEETNRAYAVAKIAALELGRAYARQHGMRVVSLMPTNLYGPGDNFDLESSHLVPALLRKAHRARARGEPTMTVWGTGTPRRELLHVDDLAGAALLCMDEREDPEPINVGTGEDMTIRAIAEVCCRVVGFGGSIDFDPSRPDGMPRKQLDVSKIRALGWAPRVPFEEGLSAVYASDRRPDWD